MICIHNGLVFDAVHEIPEKKDILFDQGKIVKIGAALEVPSDCEVVDAEGLHVYPGFVDAHSHLGTIGSSIKFEGDDVNEMTDILTPHLRGIDCIEPMDIAFREVREGGVTTVCVGPGSANVVGGTLARYERGANEMPIHHLVTLCKYYNVSADYLLDTTPSKLRKQKKKPQ